MQTFQEVRLNEKFIFLDKDEVEEHGRETYTKIGEDTVLRKNKTVFSVSRRDVMVGVVIE